MYHKKIIIALVFVFTIGYNQKIWAQAQEYVQEEVIKVPGITNNLQIPALTLTQKQTARVYVDGLGRPVQTVAVQASPLQHDIIQTNTYDNLGRQAYNYLPYVGADGSGAFRANGSDEQTNFYSNGFGGTVAKDGSPFNQSLFENSPLQRLLQSGSVGDGFQPGQHFKSASYRSNNSADNVIKWGTDATNQGYYDINTLSVTQATDEQGIQALTFTDMAGRLILKRSLINEVINGISETSVDTYYIYNPAGAISYVIPPKAVAKMRDNSNWSLTQPSINKLLFQYSYDNLGRLIERTVPGGSLLYTVYDPLNRPVLMQDGKLRASNKWNYIKYDVKGRAISQGVYTDNTYTSRIAMQTYVNTLGSTYNAAWFESRTTDASFGYYTNTIFPTANLEDLAYVYYDDYDRDQNGTADYSYQAQGLVNEAVPTSSTRGMLTIVSQRSVGLGLSNAWLINVTFYNKYGQAIQTLSNNQLTSAVSDSKTLVPDFTGTPQQTKIVKVVAGSSTTVLSAYSYDHMNRLTSIDQSYNGAALFRIAAYAYNELGQLIKKNLHAINNNSSIAADMTLDGSNSVSSTGQSTKVASHSITLNPGFFADLGSNFSASISSGFLQSIDYRYNIRGQLLSINNSTLTADGLKNNDSNDVFGMEFLYDKTDASLGNTAYFNGLVSAVKWMAKTTTLNERSYKFNYDDQNRLTAANYSDRANGSTTWVNSGAYDEKNVSYDHNGNIMTLQRNAITTGSITPIDDLQYSYDGNQLNNVTDGNGTAYTALGFKNVTGSANPYLYDVNGNLRTDPKKGLTLSYNILNKTDQIVITTAAGRYINYTYNATGTLLRKQTYDNSTLQKTTDYIDGFVYENSILQYFSMPEGRIRNISTTAGTVTLKPEYMIADQQGNVRVSFEEQGGVAVVRQENSYYPFGLIMPNSAISTPTAANKNLYNAGSEWQNDFGDMPDYYQTFYRNYDAALGRFIGVDPKAETTESLSTYQYALNNPLLYNDPLGDISAMQEANNMLNDRNNLYGGSISSDGTVSTFSDGESALQAGSAYMDANHAWGTNGSASSYQDAAVNFNSMIDAGSHHADVNNQSRMIRVVTWFHDSNGQGITVNGVSSTAAVMMLGDYYNIKGSANQGGQSGFPSFDKLWANYPCTDAQGNHSFILSQSEYYNQCAIRLGYDLIHSGAKLNNYKGVVDPKTGYPLRATELATWLKGTLGNPTIFSYDKFLNYSESHSMQGIFYEVPFNGSPAHIDMIYNGNKTTDSMVGEQFYKTNTIWYWPVK